MRFLLIFIVALLSATPTQAQTSQLIIKVQCIPSVEVAKIMEEQYAKPQEPSIDKDGDPWVMWRSASSWWLTFMVDDGKITCLVARSKVVEQKGARGRFSG